MKVTKEIIESFLSGHRSIDGLIKIETDFNKSYVVLRIQDSEGNHKLVRDDFYPFVWTTRDNANLFFGGDKNKIYKAMLKHKIGVKHLKYVNDETGQTHERLENGYRLMFYAKEPMSMLSFQNFFQKAGSPLYGKNNSKGVDKPYITLGPEEMYLIHSGNRMFKGIDDLDDLKRLVFDIETEGLDPQLHRIRQIGIRTNKGFESIIEITDDDPQTEIDAIRRFFEIVKEEKPSIVTGYNSENFDFYFFEQRLAKHGVKMVKLTSDLFPIGVHKSKKEKVLKLGGEVEFYKPTMMSCYNITDGLFAVRRAMAIDSNIESASLKYITKYSRLNSESRVYVDGSKINSTWADETLTYLYNPRNGNWFKIEDETLNGYAKTTNTITDSQGNVYEEYTDKDGVEFYLVTGRYIVYLYLQDDLDETLKVDYRYNLPNFLVCKMIPVGYDKMCTMGNAVIWKLMLLAWSYENELAIPSLIETRRFTGGLSRLFEVGFVPNVAKLDYNSLYPSIILTMGIKSPVDVSNAMSSFLEYFLTQREVYKGLKKKNDKLASECAKLASEGVEVENNRRKENEYRRLAALYDKLQLPTKIIANSFFGAFGSGVIFPHSDISCAEETTCTGRMMFRLLLSWFKNKNYSPIVGDSFLGDTPFFIKDKKTNLIDIITVKEMFDTTVSEIDPLDREYDMSEKPYYVLCKSGWLDMGYVYRHKTDKPIYRVTEGNMSVDVTEDHSLFNSDMAKIKPSEINSDTKLSYYDDISSIRDTIISVTQGELNSMVATFNATGYIDKRLLNLSVEDIEYFFEYSDKFMFEKLNKVSKAKYLFLRKLCQK